MDFAELKNDTNFITQTTNVTTALDNIRNHLKLALEYKQYNDLSMQEKVKFDTFLSYSINSLFWIYLKIQGVDMNSHDIKDELWKIKQTMIRNKEIHDRNTIRPVLDKRVAARFIKHGIHHRENNSITVTMNKKKKNKREKNVQPQNKKIKFDENLSD